ncbi:type I polyketide synthase, partial [Streptomyces sp. ODS05-4]|uniref:type I polyketide synthase n=1 Tax=Streptomyces sp. ODS05-4 TaxID=2944939 RepID=UPI00210F0C9D
GRLMQGCEAGGAMASVEASESEVLEVLAGIEGRVCVAGLNTPVQTVVSGDVAAVEAVRERFAALGRRTRRLEVSHAFHSAHMDSMLTEFGTVVADLAFSRPELTVVSSVTGERVSAGEWSDPAYWVRQVREPVRFLDAVRAVEAEGVGRYLECGPAAVLSVMAAGCVAEDSAGRFVASLPLRKGEQDEARALLRTVGALHAAGQPVDWDAVLPATATLAELPTYVFQRERYWLEVASARSGDVRAAGLESAGHPWLRAGLSLAGADGGEVFTGRLSAGELRWLADHTVFGTVLVPGTGLLEVALAAAERIGAAGVGELTVLEPLVLRGEEAVRIQVRIGEAADHGSDRTVEIHSRPENAPETDWSLHAHGTLLASPSGDDETVDLTQWPAPGAEPVPLDGYYDGLRALGLEYGPAFRGLTELWRAGRTAYALVRLPESVSAADYGLHPALLDAALHALAALDAPQDTERDSVLLPFAWSGVECRAVGGSTLRVRIDLDDSRRSARLWAADAQGAPVARVRGLELREATRDQIRVAERLEHLYAVEFRPLAPTGDQPGGTTWVLGSPALAAGADTPAFAYLDALLAHLDAGHPAPDRLLVDATSHPDAVRETDADAVRETARAALNGARRLLGEPRLAGAELVWVTRDSVAAADGDRLDGVAQAAVWGLVRAVRAEHPDRPVRLVDLDAGPADRPAVRRALAASGEPETAVRGDAVLAARLAPLTRQETAAPVAALDAGGTVLVTGGTGDLGLRLARHLVREHGVRHLVLTSRRGPDAPGADAAVRELTAAGAAAVRVTACDTADRAALARVVADIDPAHPLTGVFHLAGVVDDGLLADQDADRLDRVLAPKAAGAVHLSELTADLEGCALVLFSSASGVLGGPGQSTYAAANAFLDALAARLRAAGRPATSLSWGMWEQRQGTGMAAGLGQADVARMRRQGIGALTEAQGLRALDAALAGTRAHLVPIRLEPAALQRAVDQGTDPAALGGLLRGLVRPRPRRAADGPAGEATGLRARLAALPADERKRTLLRLVRTESAAVLGGSGPDSIGEQQVFTVYGMDSMTSVELRRRLAVETGLSLPATLAFDHPTPLAVTELILDRLALSEAPAQPAAAPLAAARHTAGEPVAVVAMACKLPGGIDTPEGFWDLLAAGGDAIGGFPERWDALDVYDPDPEAVGKSYSRHGGFLHRAEHFDAAFFGISPREAVSMDPQQRLVLEASWEALERAGLTAGALSESRTGVYLGTMGSDYGNQGDLDSLDGYFGTGNAASVLSGRVSYALGLQGPAMTVDTACSSSLVSLHLAAQALRGGECELALAGGVTVMSTPTPFVEFSRLKGLAADGRCKPFSAASDGTGWSEGVGVLVLKRLSDAERDGDRVLAVIRGSAVNQDGRSQGLTAPNGPSQQRVVRDALAAARLSAADIDAIEAHGTGTSLGDPIEAGALAEVFGPDRPADRPLYLGSLKSNIGHTQAAAGVAGVIKMILALEHEKLPRTLHAEQPSALIDWDTSGLELLQEARDWQRDADRPRRAGVSSFGLSGTNAHVVLEEAPVRDTEPSEAPDGPYPVVVSAQTEPALRAQAAAWADWLERAPQTPLADVARTAARHRTHFEQRAAITAATAQEAAALLRAVAGGDPNHPDVSLDTTTDGDLAVLFTGQGAQRLGMGRGLYEAFPVFAAAFDAVLEALGGGLREVVWGEDA